MVYINGYCFTGKALPFWKYSCPTPGLASKLHYSMLVAFIVSVCYKEARVHLIGYCNEKSHGTQQLWKLGNKYCIMHVIWLSGDSGPNQVGDYTPSVCTN